MSIQTITTRRLRVGLRLLGLLLLASPLGCSHERCCNQEGLAERIVPPANFDIREELPPPKKTDHETSGESADGIGQRKAGDDADPKEGKQPAAVHLSEFACEAAGHPAGHPLTLAEAIDTAFRLQPRLRLYLESVEQARRGEDIALAPFLPMAVAGYTTGGFDLNVGGTSTPLGPVPGFTFLPALGSIPIGLTINTGYELAEFKLQWLICDFGRRVGRYRQAGIGVDIA